MQVRGGLKTQQPAFSCSTPQLAGNLVWTAATPEGNLLPDSQSGDNKISAVWDVTLNTSLSPPAAFAAAAVAQQLVSLLSEQRSLIGNLHKNQKTLEKSTEALSASREVVPETQETSGSLKAETIEETPIPQPLQSKAADESEILMAAASVERPPGSDICCKPLAFRV